MDQTDKSKIFAFVVGIIMLTSVVGFAVFSLPYSGGYIGGVGTQPAPNQQPQSYTIPTIVERSLTSQEISQILSAGRPIIESVYSETCEECKEQDALLRSFALQYTGFVIMESISLTTGDGWDRFQIIGSNGNIIPLEGEELTPERMLDLFCSAALVQPRECLLRLYGS